jgi:PAS domain S-box-containing protein
MKPFTIQHVPSWRTGSRIRSAFSLSLRTVLVVGFSIVLGLLGFVGSLAIIGEHTTIVAFNKLLATDIKTADLSQQSVTAMMKARRSEKDFLLKYREFGFDEARSRYVTLLQANLADARESLADLRSLTGTPETTREIQSAVQAIDNYQNAFLTVVTLYGQLGFVDTGLEGQFRDYAHQIEALLNPATNATLVIDLLSIRRHEKDYLLRGRDIDSHAIRKSLAQFKMDVATAGISTELKAKLTRLADAYASRFEQYVQVSDQIALEKRRYLAAVQTIEPNLEKLLTSALARNDTRREAIARKAAQTETMTELVGLGTIVLGMLVAWIVSQRITIATRKTMEFAERITAGDLRMRTTDTGFDEFSILGRSLNHMANTLQAALESQQHRQGELESMNAEMEVRVEKRTKELAGSLSLLNATLDSTADGILAVELSGEVISLNSQFAAMWAISPQIHEHRDRNAMLASMASQVCNPDEFFRRIEIAVASPDDEAFDVLHLKDGRVIERYVKPQRIDGRTVGLVFNFRDITERKRAQAEIERIHMQLVAASRQAGQAEIATNVLHNVGNVLNSVNVSASLVTDSIAKSRISGLAKAVALLQEHERELGDYLSNDPRGKLLPAYLAELSGNLQIEREASLKELKLLGQNIDHIKEIVTMQQNYARNANAEEVVNVRDVVEEALRVNADSLLRYKVDVVCEIDDIPAIRLDKHRVLQILVNLMSNARHACNDSKRTDKRIRLRVRSLNDRISMAVSDNGVGIAAENMTKIFNHGFTTRRDGHGFGLHGAALTAKQMGGSLRAQSGGVGQGATFTLELPIKPSESLS